MSAWYIQAQQIRESLPPNFRWALDSYLELSFATYEELNPHWLYTQGYAAFQHLLDMCRCALEEKGPKQVDPCFPRIVQYVQVHRPMHPSAETRVAISACHLYHTYRRYQSEKFGQQLTERQVVLRKGRALRKKTIMTVLENPERFVRLEQEINLVFYKFNRPTQFVIGMQESYRRTLMETDKITGTPVYVLLQQDANAAPDLTIFS